MDIFIRVNESNVVEFMHCNPFDPSEGLGISREELEKQGKFVHELPEMKTKLGKRAIPMYDPDNNRIYYNYKSVPLKAETRLDMLEQAFNALLVENQKGEKWYGWIFSRTGEMW